MVLADVVSVRLETNVQWTSSVMFATFLNAFSWDSQWLDLDLKTFKWLQLASRIRGSRAVTNSDSLSEPAVLAALPNRLVHQSGTSFRQSKFDFFDSKFEVVCLVSPVLAAKSLLIFELRNAILILSQDSWLKILETIIAFDRLGETQPSHYRLMISWWCRFEPQIFMKILLGFEGFWMFFVLCSALKVPRSHWSVKLIWGCLLKNDGLTYC